MEKLQRGDGSAADVQVLFELDKLMHGTTHAINAIITGRTARTALLTTIGHRDVLVLRAKYGMHGTEIDRLSRGDAEALVVAGDQLLDAIAAMWRDHGGKVGAELAGIDPIVAAAFAASVCGMPCQTRNSANTIEIGAST